LKGVYTYGYELTLIESLHNMNERIDRLITVEGMHIVIGTYTCVHGLIDRVHCMKGMHSYGPMVTCVHALIDRMHCMKLMHSYGYIRAYMD